MRARCLAVIVVITSEKRWRLSSETYFKRLCNALVQKRCVQVIVCFLQAEESAQWSVILWANVNMQHHVETRGTATWPGGSVQTPKNEAAPTTQPCNANALYSRRSLGSVNSFLWASSAGQGTPPRTCSTDCCRPVKTAEWKGNTGAPGRRGTVIEGSCWWSSEFGRVWALRSEGFLERILWSPFLS